MNKPLLLLIAGVVSGVSLAAAPTKTKNEAVLSSDQMELINNGSKAVFIGHVILDRPPYQLKAERMTRTESSGLVEAEGRIRGTWRGDDGGQLEALGDHGRYDPKNQVAELWTDPSRQVQVNWNDTRGSGAFKGDRAVMYVSTKTVQLVDRVTGHIIPSKQ